MFTIENSNRSGERLNLKVFNSSGQVIYSGECYGEEMQLDLQSQPDGLYLLITQRGNYLDRKKLVVKK